MHLKRGNFSKLYRKYSRRHHKMTDEQPCTLNSIGAIRRLVQQKRSGHLGLFAICATTTMIAVIHLTTDSTQKHTENFKQGDEPTSPASKRKLMSYLPPVIKPNCAALLRGDPVEIALSKEMLYKETFATSSAETYMIHFNCSELRNYVANLENTAEVERVYPIAYVVIVRGGGLDQLEMLLKAIYVSWNLYCVHVEQGAAVAIVQAVQKIASCFHNVYVASAAQASRPNLGSGGPSARRHATINCMQDLVNANTPWRYLITVGERDFPLKSNAHVVKYARGVVDGTGDLFSGRRGDTAAFVAAANGHDHKSEEHRSINGTEGAPKSRLHGKLPAFYESITDTVLNREAVELIVNTFNITAPQKEHLVRATKVLREPSGLWAVKREGSGQAPCEGQYRNNICVYGVGDLRWLTQQRHLFAHEFDVSFDHIVLDCLGMFIRNNSLVRPT